MAVFLSLLNFLALTGFEAGCKLFSQIREVPSQIGKYFGGQVKFANFPSLNSGPWILILCRVRYHRAYVKDDIEVVATAPTSPAGHGPR
jgi:hypothetical protein